MGGGVLSAISQRPRRSSISAVHRCAIGNATRKKDSETLAPGLAYARAAHVAPLVPAAGTRVAGVLVAQIAAVNAKRH